MSDDQNKNLPQVPVDSETPVPATTANAAPKKGWVRFVTPALALVAALVIGGVAGVFIGQSTASASNQRTGFTQNRGGFGGGEGFPGGGAGAPSGAPGNGTGTGGANGAGAFTAGTIQSVDGDTITVKLQDGSTVKVTTSDSTKVTETTSSSVSKLKSGDEITVIGEKDSSGDVTATTIAEGQSGLGLRGFGGQRGGNGARTTTSGTGTN
jgi:Cu/Ag efflux protein CusF